MNTRVIAYWVTTGTLAFALLSGGVGELTHQWGTLETVSILGYPVYFLTLLGVWTTTRPSTGARSSTSKASRARPWTA